MEWALVTVNWKVHLCLLLKTGKLRPGEGHDFYTHQGLSRNGGGRGGGINRLDSLDGVRLE